MKKKEIELFGVMFNSLTLNEIISEIDAAILTHKKCFIHTVNVDHLMLKEKDQEFKDGIERAEYVTCDGMPILWASKFKKHKLPERLTGADITIEIFKKSHFYNFKVFVLGAAPGVALKAKENLEKEYVGTSIVGTYSPSQEELLSQEKSIGICNRINSSNANILLLALGAPKQEKWYWKYRNYLNVPVAIGVGAAIDFISGEQKRAPLVIRNIGMEWSYRLVKNPKRLWKRYIIQDSKFFPLFWKEVLRR